MFAVIALIIFVLKVFGVHPVDMIALGLAFIALALLFGGWPFSPRNNQ